MSYGIPDAGYRMLVPDAGYWILVIQYLVYLANIILSFANEKGAGLILVYDTQNLMHETLFTIICICCSPFY
jgi:hypothetical protein